MKLENLEDAIKRMGPRESLDGRVGFSGWSRMASQINNKQINIYEVGKPNLGETILRMFTVRSKSI